MFNFHSPEGATFSRDAIISCYQGLIISTYWSNIFVLIIFNYYCWLIVEAVTGVRSTALLHGVWCFGRSDLIWSDSVQFFILISCNFFWCRDVTQVVPVLQTFCGNKCVGILFQTCRSRLTEPVLDRNYKVSYCYKLFGVLGLILWTSRKKDLLLQ